MFGLSHPSYILPGKPVSIDEWQPDSEQPVEVAQQLKDNGLEYFYRAGDLSVLDMANDCIDKLLSENNVKTADIDLVVYFHTLCSSTLDPNESVLGSIVARHNLSHALTFSVAQQNCVSFIASLQVIKKYMQNHQEIQSVLIIGADKCTFEHIRNIGITGMQCDGAAAVLLERNGTRNRLIDCGFNAQSEFYEGTAASEEKNAKFNNMYFLTTHTMLQRCMKTTGIPREDLSLLLPHNVNARGWQQTIDALKLEDSKLYSKNISKTSHVYGCDGIINLFDAVQDDKLKAGDKYIMFSMGFGGVYGTAAFEH